MTRIGRTIERITAWITRREPPRKSGPGDGPDPESFDRARARTDWDRVGGSFG